MINEFTAVYTDTSGNILKSQLPSSVVQIDVVQTITAAKTFSGGATINTLTLGAPLSITQGGTGQSTANTALNALLPTQTGNSGKVLRTDGTITTWESIASSNSFTDSSFRVLDNIDNTKQLAFEVSGVTTGTTAILTIPISSGIISLSPQIAIDTASTGAVSLSGVSDLIRKFRPTTPLTANRTITLLTTGNQMGAIIRISFLDATLASFSTFKFTITDSVASFTLDITQPTLLEYYWAGSSWERIF